ncbi:MAG TPA: tetratricopeptide repeat protein [Gemmatimonadales bacterium]|nr:tetratricopeptide repeat protein [Gemmatimonadales bacterium]
MDHERRDAPGDRSTIDESAPTRDDERLVGEALSAWEAGRYRDAAAAYRAILGRDPRQVDARIGLARSLDADDQPEAALATLTEAIELAPDQTEYLVVRGSILGRIRRFPEAEADLRKVLKLHPAHGPALHELGLLLLRKGLAAPAAELLQRSAALLPGRSDAYLHLGDALNRAGDLRGAVTALERALELDPTNRQTYNILGRVLDRLGRPGEAEVLYRRAQGLDS